MKRYLERRNTRYEHQAEIAEANGYRDFSAAEAEFRRWLDDQSWTTGDGPKALFYAAAAWLRQQRVLLPGVSTLAEVVASVRHAAQQRLYTMLAGAISAAQAVQLERILQVPEGRRRSQLDLWRHAERSTTGRGMSAALHRVAEIAGLGMRAVEVPAVPATAGDRPGPVRNGGEGAEAGGASVSAQAGDAIGHGAVVGGAGHRRRP